MKTFWLCFVPLFIAVDAVGVLPMFMSFTLELDPRRVRRTVYQSVVTATIVALVFLAVGNL
ncbi:MAG: MarC family protein, partial [Thermodesulfobacteriota bacterium]|nr:MarC family protein [Thermodesulfobacteriota bacterium]